MTYPDMEKRVLETRRVGATVMQSADYTIAEEVIRGQLVHRLEAYLLSDHIADDTYTGVTTSTWPASTWQMFKARHADSWWLGWLVARRPVQRVTDRQTVEITVGRYLGYPEANMALRDLGRPVIYESVRQVAPLERVLREP